jgi:ribosomal protein S18 acetylase RimI-like enzyme
MTTTIRPAVPDDDPWLAASFRRMWLDIGIAPEDIVEDADARVLRFIADARAGLDFRGFVAEEGDAKVGCAAAQRFGGLYPDVLRPSLRKYGYVWGVWVTPDQRRTGLGRRLTEECIAAMREVSCTRVLLHASPMGRSVYEALGFVPTNELGLVL